MKPKQQPEEGVQKPKKTGQPEFVHKFLRPQYQPKGDGVETVPFEKVESYEEEIAKSEAERISRGRGFVFERRKRLPYLLQKGLGKPGRVSYDVLRRAAQSVHVVRVCITTLKEMVSKTKWIIKGRDVNKDVDEHRIKQVEDFFRYPNEQDNFRTFIDKCVEDLLVLDAVAVEKRRYPNKTLAKINVIDAAAIRPVMDEFGQDDVLIPITGKDEQTRNLPVSYVQVLNSNPWGGRESGDLVAAWPKKDFIYFHMHPMSDMNSVGYGLSPIESVLGVVSNILNADNYNGMYFEDGSFPPIIIQFMQNLDVREVERMREYLYTELEGRYYRPAVLASESEIKMHNLKDITQRDMEFQKYMDFMVRLATAAFGLTPQDIGITDDLNRATAEVMQETSHAKGYGSILNLFQEVFNQEIIWKDFGYEDIEFAWSIPDSLNASDASAVYDTALRNASMTLNEVREKRGQKPFPEWADVPMLLTPNGYVPAEPQAKPIVNPIDSTKIGQEGVAVKPQQEEAEHKIPDEVGGETPFRDENEKGETEKSFKKSIMTKDGKYRCFFSDLGVGQPFICYEILTGEGYVIKPPVAVNLDSQRLEEDITNLLSEKGLNVVPVKRMTEKEIVENIFPTPEVAKEFVKYQTMTPEYDSEKWRSKNGGSRKYPYYLVSKYVEGRTLNDPLLLADMRRVPNEYQKAIQDLANLWKAEKQYVLGDRRSDQVICTPNKRIFAFDFQFRDNPARYNSTKDAYANTLKQVPELYELFMKLTGQGGDSKVGKFIKSLLK